MRVWRRSGAVRCSPVDLVFKVLPVAYARDFETLRAEVLQAVRKLSR